MIQEPTNPMPAGATAAAAAAAPGHVGRSAHDIRCLLLAHCSIPIPPDPSDVAELVTVYELSEHIEHHLGNGEPAIESGRASPTSATTTTTTACTADALSISPRHVSSAGSREDGNDPAAAGTAAAADTQRALTRHSIPSDERRSEPPFLAWAVLAWAATRWGWSWPQRRWTAGCC